MDNKKNILLLEDDTILAQTMVSLLEQENYNVTLVEDGERGFRLKPMTIQVRPLSF